MSRASLDHVAAILDAYDDDAPRLVYADDLIDRGDPLGEIIQLQCELQRLRPSDGRPLLGDALRRYLELERELLKRLDAQGDRWHPIRFRRGLPEEVTLQPHEVAEKASELFARSPFVTCVRLEGPRGARSYVDFAKTPELARIRELEVLHARSTEPVEEADWEIRSYADVPSAPSSHDHGDDILQLLAQHADLPRLQRLAFREGRPTAAGLRALFSSQKAPGLRDLELGDGKANLEVIEAICSGPVRPFRRLDFEGGELELESIARLVSDPRFETVESLNLSRNPVGDEALLELARTETRKKLRKLSLQNTKVTDAGIAAWIRAGGLRGLAVLQLNKSAAGPDTARALANAGHDVASLKVLGLSACQLDRSAAKDLARARFSQLESLDVSANALMDEGVGEILRSDQMSGLRSLYLTGTQLAGSFVDALAVHCPPRIHMAGTDSTPGLAESLLACPAVESLRQLDLSWCREGLAAEIAESAHLGGLQSLTLQGAKVDDDGLMRLVESDHLRALFALSLPSNRVGDAGLARLAQSPAAARFLWLDLRFGDFGRDGLDALEASSHLDGLRFLGLYNPSDAYQLQFVARFGSRTDTRTIWPGAL